MQKENAPRRRRTLPVVAAVLQPVTKRLARMEALLIEMRHEQDVKFKRLTALQAQIDGVAERIELGRRTRVARRRTLRDQLARGHPSH